MCKSVVISTLWYDGETWTPLACHSKCLQGFVMGCLRILWGISLRERKRITEIRGLAVMETVETMLQRTRLRWLGHAARMEENHLQTTFGVQTFGR